MVILEAAAIGAASYGAYKGGDAAVRKGKETHKEMQRERIRRHQRNDLASKKQDRKSRLDAIANLRQTTRTGPIASSTSSSTSSLWPLGGSKRNNNNNNNDTTTASTATATTTTASTRSIPATSASSSNSNNNNDDDVSDRHKAVMAKLKAKPVSSKKKGLFSNPFKKK